MCGIYLSLDHGSYQDPSQYLQEALSKRGPDAQHIHHVKLGAQSRSQVRHDESTPERQSTTGAEAAAIYLSCASTVLSLRGETVVQQPIFADTAQPDATNASFLCWNGEAWRFNGSRIRQNDAQHVFSLLSHVVETSATTGAAKPEAAIAEALASYDGPFAFAFYDHRQRRIYFGRDSLGRRSLLFARSDSGCVLISSVSDESHAWHEIEADGVYWISLGESAMMNDFDMQRTQYHSRGEMPHQPDGGLSRESKVCAADEVVSLDALHHLLLKSLQLRLDSIPQTIPRSTTSSQTARMAVLFSGGIDCSLLARLAHDILDPHETIDLLNVAFENPRVHGKALARGECPYSLCPDRKTALSSLAELRRTCPSRAWRLVDIDIPYSEFLAHRTTIVALMRPHDTEMDLSIAAALYFASRGAGTLADDARAYTTPARVLLSGLGADELFGGYTRHATAFARGGPQSLAEELALDVARLGKRNLGRDDRVISHWGREARFPFLDEPLLAWARGVPQTVKCGFGRTYEVGDPAAALDPAKLILRRLALRLGLEGIAREKKRAIQFGARTAKMEGGRTKGTQSISA